MADGPKDFRELVTWATWHVIAGITKGEPLHSLMFAVIEYARRWKPPQEPKL